MDKVIEIPKNPCFICKKREATRLCDFVIGYIWTTMKDEHGRMIGRMHDTCDMPLCEFCAYKTGAFDFCPHHANMLNDLKPEGWPRWKKQWLR